MAKFQSARQQHRVGAFSIATREGEETHSEGYDSKMTMKKSVFGSRGEERGFRSIEHTWGEEYRVFPQFSFSALFEPDASWRDTSNLFFKTSIDYVLCTQAGQPLLAIDFDGLGQGFDRDGQYVQVQETRDPHRKLKFDFKLRYAKKSVFPYYVVASDEFRHLGQGIELTVVDGIIGSELSRIDFRERIPSVVEEHRDIIDNMPPDEQSDYIQDLVTSQEVESDFAFNPITKKWSEVMNEIRQFSDLTSLKESYRYYHEPELPDLEGPGLFGSVESQRARFDAMDKIERVGCVCVLADTPVGEVSDMVWMRNVGHSLSLVNEIAELLAYSKLLRLLRKRDATA